MVRNKQRGTTVGREECVYYLERVCEHLKARDGRIQ